MLQYYLCTTWVDDPAIRTEEHEARLVLADPKTWRWKPDAPETPEIPAGWKVEGKDDPLIHDSKIILERQNSATKEIHYQLLDRASHKTLMWTCGWVCATRNSPVRYKSVADAVADIKKYDREIPNA